MKAFLAAAILVFAIWPSEIFATSVSQWIVIIAAALLFIHAFSCKKCGGICHGCCSMDEGKMKKPKSKSKRKKRK